MSGAFVCQYPYSGYQPSCRSRGAKPFLGLQGAWTLNPGRGCHAGVGAMKERSV